MGLGDVKIVIWCGNAPNQRALAQKIAARFNVTGIVIDEHKAYSPARGKRSFVRLILDRLRFRRIYEAWGSLMSFYARQFPHWPGVPVLRVQTINDKATENFTNKQEADLVVVSGTALIKSPLVNLPLPIGIINLHTGLSPYVKGGPNCTNWCIANNEWHLVGNTIMWLNAGIDSGNIIATERIDIRSAKNLTEAHIAVMEHAHDLYCRSIGHLVSGQAPPNSVPQSSLGKGNLYLTKMWTAERKKNMLRNWTKRKSVQNYPDITTVPLPS